MDGPAYDLESDATPNFEPAHAAEPAAPQAAPEPAPPAEQAPEAPPTTDDPEDAIEVQGGKYVPLNALKATREELKALRDEAKQLRDYYGQTQGWQPYVNFLQAHPELMRGEPVQAKAPEADQPKAADPKAERIAQRLDLYTADGKPDVSRAADILAIIDEAAAAKAQQAVQPITQKQHYDQSVRNYNAALHLEYPGGVKVDADMLAELWRQMPVELTSDVRVAQTIADAAYANGLRTGRIKAKPAAPAAPPPVLQTEPVSGRKAPVLMTDFERGIARSRNMNDTTWADRTKGFTPKSANVLEDD